MSGLIKPAQWALTPALVDPKWGWVFQGLQILVPYWGDGVPFDLVSGRRFTINSTPTWVTRERGRALDYDSTDYIEISLLKNLGGTSNAAMSFFMFGRCEGNLTSRQRSVRLRAASGSVFGHDFSGSATSDPHEVFLRRDDSTFVDADSAPDAYVLNEDTAIGMTWSTVSDVVLLFVNGKNVGSVNATNSKVADTLSLGSNTGSLSQNGPQYLFLLWDRELTAANMQQLADDPFGPIRMLDEAGVVVVAPSGVGALTFSTIAISGTGVEEFIGSGALALAVPAIAGTGEEKFTATGALALGVPFIAGAGVEEFTATGALALNPIAIAGTGVARADGIGNLVLGPPLIVGTGVQEFIASGTLVLSVPAIAGVGVMQPSATGVLTVPGLVIVGAGVEVFTAIGALALGAASGFSAGFGPGFGGITTSLIAIAGVGAEEFIGSGALALSVPTIFASAIEELTATGVLTIARPSINGSGIEIFTGAGALTIPGLAISGTAIEQLIGSGVLLLGVPTITGIGARGLVTEIWTEVVTTTIIEAWTEVPVPTSEIWTKVSPAAPGETWTEVAPPTTEIWTEVSTAATGETWTEVPK